MKQRRSAALLFIPGTLLAPVTTLAQPQPVVDEIVVTGTYIRRPSQFDSPSPLVVLDREEIDTSGAARISEITDSLTINTGSQNNPDAFTQNLTTGTSNVNLRGLGVSSTLVLLNGGRQTASAVTTDRGENFVDLSSLPPMIAFDRVEVLKDGAAALYGSEAVAGVVNYITRTDFRGFEFSLDAQTVHDHPQNDLQFSGLVGTGSNRTGLLFAFNYLDRDPLTTRDRRLSGPGIDVSQAGNPGSFLVPSLPGNPAYQSVWTAAFDSDGNGVADFVQPQLGLPAVPGANPPVFADPACSALAAQDPKIVPDIAMSVPSPGGAIDIGLCQFDFGDYYTIVPRETRAAGYLELTHRFSDTLNGRIEMHAVNNRAERNNSPSFPFARFPGVPATHPDNPFGTDVLFIGRLIGPAGPASPSTHNSDTQRVAFALSGQTGQRWRWDADLQWSGNKIFIEAEDVLSDRFALAMNGFGGADCDPQTGTPGDGACLYFNPFGSALTGSGTVNSASLYDHLLGTEQIHARTELLTAGALASALFGDLRGGPVGVAIGVQHRDESIRYQYDEQANNDNYMFLIGNPDFSDDRNVNAVFAELALPLSETVDLQLAARREDYGGGVRSTDPKATMLWRPSLGLSVRASIGTAFRAPSMFQTFGTQTTLAQLTDPNVGTAQFFPVRTQPDPDGSPLRPEEADIRNVGITWAATDQLELGLDYWSFRYSDVLIQQNPQALLNAAAAGDVAAQSQVIRDPGTGLLLRVLSYYDNASSLDTDGVDLSMRYNLFTRDAGSFRFGLNGTRIMSYDLNDPQAGRVDGAGRRNFANFATSTPRWRLNASMNWQLGNHGANLVARHIDSYSNDEVAAGAGPEAFTRIASFTTLDAQYSYRFSGVITPTLSVGGINLTNQDPPSVATNGGYDSKVHDPRGRILYARLTVNF
jgi:iron complex outermembrane recepter protein